MDYVDRPGLSNKIALSGHWVEMRDGAFVTSDDTAVQAIMDSYSLDEAKTYRCNEVSQKAKALRDKVIKTISAGEMASWPIKLAEAAKFAATGLPADAPMLSAEAEARGITLADLVAKVGGNASVFAVLEATIGGVDGKHRDAIKALTTFEEVAAYDFSAGWPEV